MMRREAIEQLGVSHQDDLNFALLRVDRIGKQPKILEACIAESLRFVDDDCSPAPQWTVCNRALERLNQFKLAAMVRYSAELRQHDAHHFLEAELRIWNAGELKVREPAREDRAHQSGFSGSRFAQQQHESALIVQQSPFQCGQTFAMSRAKVQDRRRRCESERRSVKSKVPVIHSGYTRSLRTATIGSPVRLFTTPIE